MIFFTIIGVIVSAGKTGAVELSFKLAALKFDYAAMYDDNILHYSDRDLRNFENRSESHPSLLSTCDDWQNDYRLKFYFEGPKIAGNNLDIWYFGKFSQFYRNPFSNYSTHTLLINQKIGKALTVKLRYFYMPDYYLREYHDKDLNDYYSCAFDDHQAGAGVGYKLNKKLEFSLSGEFEQIYYNKFFTEYDSELWSGNAGIDYKFTNNIRGLLNVSYAVSENVGYKSASASAGLNANEDTEYGDSSYDEETYQAELRCRLKDFLSKQDLWMSLQYKLRHRIYTTDNALTVDPYHSTRGDDRHRLILSLTRKITSKLESVLSYTREWRVTQSDYAPVKEVKDFTQNIFSLGLTYSIF